MGRALLYGTLGAGGTAYFAPERSLDIFWRTSPWCDPPASFVPRIWDILAEVQRSWTERADDEATCSPNCEQDLLGGRYSRR